MRTDVDAGAKVLTVVGPPALVLLEPCLLSRRASAVVDLEWLDAGASFHVRSRRSFQALFQATPWWVYCIPMRRCAMNPPSGLTAAVEQTQLWTPSRRHLAHVARGQFSGVSLCPVARNQWKPKAPVSCDNVAHT